ncbi:MAG: TetR/AcrR family transcriptional regulator [Solirubrobacterales bacterium]
MEAAATQPGQPRRVPRRRRDELRERILRSALELAETTPFHDLTVEQIARAVGISRSAFYLHFRDKHDLLLVALEEVAGELRHTAERWWLPEGAPAERIRVAVAAMVSVYAEHAALLRVATEASNYNEEVREAWLRIIARFIARAAERIGAEQRNGLISESLDAAATAEALVWMAERCCNVYLGRGERSAEEVVEQLASVWAAALYPGVTPARELRPDASAGPLWGVPPPSFE